MKSYRKSLCLLELIVELSINKQCFINQMVIQIIQKIRN